MLQNRDYTIIIDKSGSMYTKDQMGGKSRWALMQESTIALAYKCEELDPDGITVYLFSGRFKRYDNVTAAKVVMRRKLPSFSRYWMTNCKAPGLNLISLIL